MLFDLLNVQPKSLVVWLLLFLYIAWVVVLACAFIYFVFVWPLMRKKNRPQLGSNPKALKLAPFVAAGIALFGWVLELIANKLVAF